MINVTLGERRRELQMEADALSEAAEEAEFAAKEAAKTAVKELVDGGTAGPITAAVAGRATEAGGWVPPTPQGLAGDLGAKAARLRAMADAAMAAVPPKAEPVFTDATPEAMMELLERQRGRGFLIYPEASELLTQATRTDTRSMETAKFARRTTWSTSARTASRAASPRCRRRACAAC
ncbi:hypothetical protein GCM10023147_15680 [Tsukamurella soli]|uniref:DUF222 domain-containing protein n=1 Tax=Tsukamurella soli TaxID=644556 RepID=A0ABP8JDY7_9ACTN